MESSGFFDAEELVDGGYDKEYVAQQFADYFKLFIGNGVFINPTNQLKVIPGGGMNVIVKEGWAFINGYWYHNDSDLTIAVPPNLTATDQTDGIFIQYIASNRDAHAIIAADRTEVNREAPYYELKIAEVSVPVGATSVTAAQITDTRTDENVCGFVKGLLEVVSTDDLFDQFRAIFEEWFTAQTTEFESWRQLQEGDFETWFEQMKGQLSQDAAGNLQNEIDALTEKEFEHYNGLIETTTSIQEVNGNTVISAVNAEGTVTTTISEANGVTTIVAVIVPTEGIYQYTKTTEISELNGVTNIEVTYTKEAKE